LQILLSFNEDAKAVLKDAQVVETLELKTVKMDIESAIILFYTGNYSEVQWEKLSTSVNSIMDSKLRRKYGGILPCMTAIKKQYAAFTYIC
jgi:hypothetical protein